jgi:CRP-like cAMP-binding protein
MEDRIAFEAATPGRRLSSVPFLNGCDESSFDALEAELEWLSVPGGATLFCEDQLPDALYVVIAECFGVTVRGSDGGEVRVARCQVGEIVARWGCLEGDDARRPLRRFATPYFFDSGNPPLKG